MTAPAGVTTPKEAAKWAWDHNGGLLAQNMPVDSIKPKHFSTRPMKDVQAITCANEAALKEFRKEWEALQKQHNVKVNTPAAAPATAAKTEAQLVYDDMRRQFELWKKGGCQMSNRGAWWGSSKPGVTSGAKAVPSGEIRAITELAKKGNWVFKNSFSGDLAWHKAGGAGKPEFIYHTKTP